MLGAALCLVVLVACSSEPPATESAELESAVAKEAATQAPDMVDVTLYFREGRGADAALVPVVREVPVGSDLARTALDLTLQGPTDDDPRTLRPAVPPTTKVRSFAVSDGTAAVDLSRHVLRDAEDVGKRPEHELLALAAIVNTLTEFPGIARVALSVDGKRGGRFWGGWGLPRMLFRDESVIDAGDDTVTIPGLGAFSRRAQEAGTPRRPRGVVRSVRIRPRATYLRVTLELADGHGGDLAGPLPPTQAKRRGKDVRISVAARGRTGLAGNHAIDDPAFRGARVDVRQAPPSVSVTVRPHGAAVFALRTLTDPTRVVLDIRR